MKSRISPNAKQQKLKAKLQSIKSRQQLTKIFASVQQQNNTLREDVYALKYKVDLLLQKQKNDKSFVSKQDEAKNKQIHMYQIQLKEQYKIMQELKKRKEHSTHQKGTDQITERAIEVANKIKIVDLQLNQLKKEITDLKKEGQRLQMTLANHEEQEKRNQPKINEFSSQNGQLKKKILSLRKIGFEKEHQSVKIMNSMYSVKTKFKKNEELAQEIQNPKLGNTSQMSKPKTQAAEVQSLLKQVEELKKEVQRKEKEYNKSQAVAQKKKDDLLLQNKQLVSNQKQLEDKRARALRQLNKYRSIWTKHLQLKNNSKNLKEFITTSSQVQEYSQQQQPLRRDYAGIMGGRFSFDDRVALKNNRKSYMVGFIVYELDQAATLKNHLVALKAIYDDSQANLNLHIPVPGHVLNKCKMSKYMLVEGDFIKLFKVKYQSTDSRIIKIEIRTNKNNRYEFGDKRQFNDINAGQNVYGFDISVQEYPVSLFGSYNNVRTQWYLQSLGVEINELSANNPLLETQK